MFKHVLLVGVILVTGSMSSWSMATAGEAGSQEDDSNCTNSSVLVQCHGRLRHGVVAIGGETTGTTITFHRITWELQLPDDASREFAQQHHKQSVAVTGTLRKIVGTADRVRWIIDATRISELDSREVPQEVAKLNIRGTLRAALSQTGNTPELSISTDAQIWNLDFAADRQVQTAAESLIGQHVHVAGILRPPPERTERTTEESREPVRHSVRVESIKAAPCAAAAPRLFE